MSRLIDADNLLIQIRQIDFLKEPNCTKLSACEIMKIINEQPTAYDVEKVVAELETLRIDKCNYFGVLNVVAEKYDRANEMLDDAIDIVRKGGVK